MGYCSALQAKTNLSAQDRLGNTAVMYAVINNQSLLLNAIIDRLVKEWYVARCSLVQRHGLL